MRTAMATVMAATVLAAQAPAAKADPFAPLRFLEGAWQMAEADGTPGKAGAGEFSLQQDLGGHLLVRRNVAEYPAQGGRPAFRHEDLMWIFPENGKLKALYMDNEGHVIRYDVAAPSAGAGAVFLSSGEGPRFRLSYVPAGPDLVELAFDIAAPGKDFANYIKAKVRRKK